MPRDNSSKLRILRARPIALKAQKMNSGATAPISSYQVQCVSNWYR